METSKPSRAEIQPGVWIDSRRALWIEAWRLLVVADLHWGYAESHRRAGHLVPLWGDDEIRASLDSLRSDYQPGEMIWLGDSLHHPAGRTAAEAFVAGFEQSGGRLTVLAGNHDRSWARAPHSSLRRGEYLFHHGDRSCGEADRSCRQVIGHFHPAVSWGDGAGTRLRIPALVSSPRRLILPAFSPWAAGAVWNQKLEPGETLWAIAPSRVFAVRVAQPPVSSA